LARYAVGLADGVDKRLAIRILKYVLNYLEELDELFHALSDPSRRVIVERLSQGPASVTELAAPLPMSLPAVVQHVKVLETAGLIKTEKIGRVRTCHLQLKRLDGAEDWIQARRAQWERRLDRLGDYLAATEPVAAPEQKRKKP
jgi:DNA-binding transcriptional ArsR family regulator